MKNSYKMLLSFSIVLLVFSCNSIDSIPEMKEVKGNSFVMGDGRIEMRRFEVSSEHFGN